MKKIISLILVLILITQVFSGISVVATANSSSTAKLINTNTTYTDCLTWEEQFMWYKFSLEKQSYICLSFTHDFIHTDFEDDVSWYVGIYNSEMDIIEEIEVLGRKTTVNSAQIGLPNGTYYIQIRWGEDCFDVDYSLNIKANVSVLWETEFNDNGSTADEIELNKTYNASLTYQNQRDWFVFKSDKTQYISLKFTHELVDTTDHVWDVTIYDEQYNELEEYKIKGRTEKTKTEKLKISKGTYYVVVKLGDDWEYALNETYKLNVSEYLAKPTLRTISNTSSGVKITWGKVSGADSYEVYRKVKGGSYSKVGTTSKTYFTDKKAKSGKKYYYVVKAVNEAGKSDSSSSLSKYYLADPSLKTPKSTKSGVSLKWTKTAGAQGYIIYRKTSGGSYTKLKTEKGVSNLSYVDKSAKKGTKYYYKVKAYYSKSYSAYSNTKSVTDKY